MLSVFTNMPRTEGVYVLGWRNLVYVQFGDIRARKIGEPFAFGKFVFNHVVNQSSG